MILFHLTIAVDSFDLILQFGLYRYRYNRSCETLARYEWKADDSRIKANRRAWRWYWRIEHKVNQRSVVVLTE